jgi:4-hydroxy-tetrahydrodipicolinate reductase
MKLKEEAVDSGILEKNMNKIRVALSGSNGRMGSVLTSQIIDDNELELVSAFDSDTDINTVLKEKIDILVDFTVADSAHNIITKFLESKIPVVSGTTAQNKWFSEYEKLIKKYNTSLAVIPNFSIGAMLLEKFGKIAKQYIPDAELIEYHHSTKRDKPSGTAKKIAGSIGINEENIHAIRLPGFLAHHELIFGKSGETLHIKHDTSGRDCYYWGIKKTIQKIVNDKKARFYKGLDEIIL